MKEVFLQRAPVELYQLLKLEGLVASGGEAKCAISEGQVTVNGAVETRKRKKITYGDIIEFKQDKLCVRQPEAS